MADPARRAANEIQLDLSAELDKVIAFQVTGQPQFRDDYSNLLNQQIHDYDILRANGPQLGEDVNRNLVGFTEGGVLVDPAHNLKYVAGSPVWSKPKPC